MALYHYCRSFLPCGQKRPARNRKRPAGEGLKYDTAGKLPAGEVWRAKPSKNILLLLIFAGSAGKNEQQIRNSAGLQALVASLAVSQQNEIYESIIRR
jgi:hypothetical protein